MVPVTPHNFSPPLPPARRGSAERSGPALYPRRPHCGCALPKPTRRLGPPARTGPSAAAACLPEHPPVQPSCPRASCAPALTILRYISAAPEHPHPALLPRRGAGQARALLLGARRGGAALECECQRQQRSFVALSLRAWLGGSPGCGSSLSVDLPSGLRLEIQHPWENLPGANPSGVRDVCRLEGPVRGPQKECGPQQVRQMGSDSIPVQGWCTVQCQGIGIPQRRLSRETLFSRWNLSRCALRLHWVGWGPPQDFPRAKYALALSALFCEPELRNKAFTLMP